MNPVTRIVLCAALCLTALSTFADVIPRLGENVVRPALDESNGVPIDPFRRTFPAVADLNLVSDDPDTRRFAVAWLQETLDSTGVVPFNYISVAIVDSQGDLIAGPSVLFRNSFKRLGNPSIAVDRNGYFTVSWSVVEFSSSAGEPDIRHLIYARTFRPEDNGGDLCPADGLGIENVAADGVLLDTDSIAELDEQQGVYGLTNPQLSIDSDSSADGRTVIVFPDQRGEPNWGVYAISANLEIDEPLPDPSVWCEPENAHARLVLPDPMNPQNSVARITGSAEYQVAPRVAINPNNEQAAVVWRSRAGAIELQRLDPLGGLLGEPVEVARSNSVQVTLHDPDVDYPPDGSIRVVWERNDYGSQSNDLPANSQILMSRFDDAGNPLEEGLSVARGDGSSSIRFRSLRSPRVQARDLDGNFAVAWSRQQGECPVDGFGRTRFVTPDFPCSDDGSAGIGLTESELFCDLTLRTDNGVSDDAPRCRAQIRLLNFPGASPGEIALAPDRRTDWDDFGPPRTTRLEWGRAHPTLEQCRRVFWSDRGDARSKVVRQPCSGSSCISCEDQARAAGFALPTAPADAAIPAAATAPESGSASRRGSIFTEVDLRLRWFQSEFQSDDATPVDAITVSDLLLRAGGPALAMGRTGDMLVSWIAEDVPDPSGTGTLDHALVTQNLASPVELSINDVGILEGPLTRATGNFTLTANKRYPTRPGECDSNTPRPTVSLLTADGSASFLPGADDYERTTGTLSFDPCDPLAPLSLGFPVPVNDDNVFEDTESFFIDLFDEQNAIVVRRQGTGAIVDNDPPATVSAPTGIVEVCEDGTIPLAGAPRCPGTGTPRTDIELAFELNIAQEVEGSGEFVTLDGSAFGSIEAATAGDDYEPVAGELQFLPGTTQAFLSIELIEDNFAELPEQFFVELTGADNLTLPADDEDLRINVNIIDDDVCSTAPAWFLPDPNATVPERLPTHGTAAERSGYFCVVNPEGFETCPWQGRLDLAQGEEPWLARTSIVFSAAPDPDGITADDIAAAQSACALIAGSTGAIRYTAGENLPDPDNPVPVQTRTQDVLFINGAADPEVRTVTQSGGDCTPEITPAQTRFFPVGGEATFNVTFGDEPACEFTEWTAQVDSTAEDWLSIDGASIDTGQFTFNGPGSFSIEVDPYLPEVGPAFDRIGVINVGDGVQVIQEAPLIDHFDDGVPPDPAGWEYTEPNAWSEAGTHLSATTFGLARVIANPAFAGCSRCIVETTVRFDQFSKGRAIVYLWWRGPDQHLRLVADEFFDSWTLVQRISGVDRVLREFNADVIVGQEYPVRIEYRDDLGGPLITVDVDGQAMCPTPGPGVQPCVPYNPDPDNPASTPIIGSGVVGLGVEATGASFNRLRVIRSDELPFPLSVLFSDGFEAR